MPASAGEFVYRGGWVSPQGLPWGNFNFRCTVYKQRVLELWPRHLPASQQQPEDKAAPDPSAVAQRRLTKASKPDSSAKRSRKPSPTFGRCLLYLQKADITERDWFVRFVPKADAATSAYVRPSHLLQGCFDTSPRFGFFRLTLLLEVSSLLSGLDDCHLAMGLKQLSGIVMDVDLTHPHDAVLLSLKNKLTHTWST
jgi:hypothetical protein